MLYSSSSDMCVVFNRLCIAAHGVAVNLNVVQRIFDNEFTNQMWFFLYRYRDDPLVWRTRAMRILRDPIADAITRSQRNKREYQMLLDEYLPY